MTVWAFDGCLVAPGLLIVLHECIIAYDVTTIVW